MRWIRALIALSTLTLVIILGVAAFGGAGGESIRKGVPKGADFLAFFTGGVLLEEGHGDRLYDRGLYRRTQDRYAPSAIKYYAVYPPPLYQAMSPLRRLGYERAAQLFLVGQVLLFALAAWILTGAVPELEDWRIPAFALMAASPVAMMNTLTGQGAGTWLALLAVGLALIRRDRPIVAGIVLGLLCAKPSLALAVAGFVVLTAQWRVLAGFAIGGALLVAGNVALHGLDPWFAWIEWMRSPAASGFWPIPQRQMTWRTLFGWPIRSSVSLSGLIMPTVALGGLAVSAWLARRTWGIAPTNAAWPVRAGLVLSALLLTLPHMIEYDLGTHALLVLGFATLVRERPDRAGFAMLAAVYIAPFVFPLSEAVHVALGPLVMTVLLVVAARRVERR